MPKKVKPLYNKITTLGEISELNPDYNLLHHRILANGDLSSDFLMHPYTEYIPLLYLLQSSVGHNMGPFPSELEFNAFSHKDGFEKWKKKYEDSYIKKFINFRYNEDKKLLTKSLTQNLKNWLEEDGITCLNKFLYTFNIGGYPRYNLVNRINYRPIFFRQRAYQGAFSLYSMYKYSMNKFTPHVLAVILPENYLYLKYKLLVHNVLDLSKVVILVDNELDTTKFPSKPFRKLYKDALLPEIMKTNCDVWNVPLEFIKEKCFSTELSFRGLGPLEKKRLTTALIEGFCQQMIGNRDGEKCLSGDTIGASSSGTVVSSYSYNTSSFEISDVEDE